MRKHIFNLSLLCALCAFTSCAPKQVIIYCEPQQANIYVDDQLVGQGIVHYYIPRKQKYITVSCGEEGIFIPAVDSTQKVLGKKSTSI